ncbi:MAG: hypothetical protein IT431_06545 [Phycisphaerales bacterium]|nr:hypothetical protein [Phycisphaerales bacterium]
MTRTPRSTPRALLAALTSLLAPPLLAQSEPPQPEPPQHPAQLDLHAPNLRISSHPLGVTHAQLRWAATPEGERALPAFAPATRAVESAAGTPRIWLILDPDIATRDELTLPAWLDGLPLERVVEPAHTEQTREAIGAYLDEWLLPHALAGAESWETTTLPAMRERGQMLLDALTGESQLLPRTLDAVGLRADLGTPTVELVRHAPPPGAVTYRTPRGPVSIVAEDGLDDDTLLEVTLHETLHAFDSLAPADNQSVLTDLRRALTDRGLAPNDPAFRTVWHTLFFVHAAEMVRRDGRPGYTDYAERAGIYEKSGPAATLMRELWPRVLDAELGRAEFVRRVVEQAPGAG